MSWKKILKAIDDDGNTICPKCDKKVPYGDESAAIDLTGECFDCGDKSMRDWEAKQ